MVEDTICLSSAKVEGDLRASREKADKYSVTSVDSLYLVTRLRKCLVESHWWTHGYSRNSEKRART